MQNKPYYYLTLTALGNSVSVETMSTLWTTWADNDRRVEIRKASRAGEPRYWATLKENWLSVDNTEQLLLFLRTGGHALISHDVVEAWLPEFLESVECRRYGDSPFISEYHLPPGAEDRFPTPLIRKRVYARDDYKCQVCGYAPRDHPSVRLEIHHIIEHHIGGKTLDHNLITLCKSCHETASPPDPWLRADLFSKVLISAADYHRVSHEQGVTNYRLAVERIFSQDEDIAWPAPLDYLEVDDTKLAAIEEKRFTYRLLCANTVVRYYELSEWKRVINKALKLNRQSTGRARN